MAARLALLDKPAFSSTRISSCGRSVFSLMLVSLLCPCQPGLKSVWNRKPFCFIDDQAAQERIFRAGQRLINRLALGYT